jgi:hypothetical protein
MSVTVTRLCQDEMRLSFHVRSQYEFISCSVLSYSKKKVKNGLDGFSGARQWTQSGVPSTFSSYSLSP